MSKSSFSEDRNRLGQWVQTSSVPIPLDSLTPSIYPSKNNFINQIDPSLLSHLNASQIQAIQTFIDQTITNEVNHRMANINICKKRFTNQKYTDQTRRSKLIDIRFIIDLLFSQFYVVLLVGKDVRKGQRSYPVTDVTKAGNLVAAFILIIAINLLISAFFLLSIYLLKSALNIDLLPGHFSDQVERLKQ